MDDTVINQEIDSGGKEINYIFHGNVYCCVYHDGNIWIGIKAIAKLLETEEKVLSDTFDALYKKKALSRERTFQYYFYDGNRQSYKNTESNYYSLEACVAVAIALQNIKLLDYISWAREMLVKFGSGALDSVKTSRNYFLNIRSYHHKNRDVVVPHQHNCYELVYYVSGSGKTANEYGNFNYYPDTLTVVAPYVRHEEYNIEEGDCICFTFFTDVPLPTAVFFPTPKFSASIRFIYKNLCELFSLLEEDNARERENRAILIIYYLNKMLSMTTKEKEYDATIEYIKKYLHSNYSYKINFDILSEQVGYSPNHLNALFKRTTGQSLYSYLSDIRLLRAKEMLGTGNAKMKVIARKCGFSSEARFSQFFKEKTGVPPLVYRKISGTPVEGGIWSKKRNRSDKIRNKKLSSV